MARGTSRPAPRQSLQDLLVVGRGLLAESAPLAAKGGTNVLSVSTASASLIPVRKGVPITTGYCFLATAGASMTLAKFCLWEADGTLRASSATAHVALNNVANNGTFQSAAYATPWTPSADGVMMAGLVCVGGTGPTVLACASQSGSGAAIGSGAKLQATAGTQTDAATVVWVAIGTHNWFAVS